jgi:hypothetical protein
MYAPSECKRLSCLEQHRQCRDVSTIGDRD